jgi:predicted TIM-barrel fold metal-dependent hydrolase
MRIDVHAHYWTEEYLDVLVDLGKEDARAARGLGAGDGAELDARLRLMDQAGIEVQVLSAAPQLPYSEVPEKAARAAKYVNDQYAELAERHRDRFRAFAALPMPTVEESVGELDRALDELGMAGVVMNTTVLGHALVEPRFEPIFAELNRRGAVLYLHPAGDNAVDYIGAPEIDTSAAQAILDQNASAVLGGREWRTS